MALVRITDFAPNYLDLIGNKDLINYSVYSDVAGEKIGTIENILVDEENGHFRYFVVDIGFWIFGKKVLLPVEYTQIKFAEQRVYAQEMTKGQAENLPEFDHSLRVDHEYENQISAIYPPRSLNALSSIDPLGNPVSTIVPYSPITIGTLSTLTSPNAPPNAGSSANVTSEYDRDLQADRRS